MQTTSPVRLLGKVLLLTFPGLLVVAAYFWCDPFVVLYHYDRYPDNLITFPNRDFISTQTYLNTYRQRPYQSFILGSSRSLAYRVRDWTPYLPPGPDTLAFHYDASNESLFGVWKKLEFLEQHGSGPRNVLLVCDYQLLRVTTNLDVEHKRKDPRLVGESMLAFQATFLRDYLSNGFFWKYFKRRLTGRFTPDMTGVLEPTHIRYDPRTNDMLLPELDAQLRTDSAGYYARSRQLGPRPARPEVAPAVIGAAQLAQLRAIRAIFQRQHTSYQLLINPLYEQRAFNPADLAQLQQLFGAGRIHDFSGVNEFTRETGNYYDYSHYRPKVARQLLRRVYGPVRR
ncbi:MAG: hypothetical protein ACRYFX_20820 [Janthinobacterium lividum]